MQQDLIDQLKLTLEQIDAAKDEYLFDFIREYWPRNITPNHLTIIRIFTGILLFFLLFNFKNSNGLIILPLFLFGALTDLFDGAVARCLNMKSKFGEITDPIADRVLIIPMAIYVLMNYQWLLFSIVFFEIINAWVSMAAQGKPIVMGSNIFGKTKMVIQSLVLLGVLIFWPQDPNFLFVGLLWASIGFMIISIAMKTMVLQSYYVHKNI